MGEYFDSLTKWNDLEKTLTDSLTKEEINEIDLKVKMVGEVINAKQSEEIIQQAL